MLIKNICVITYTLTGHRSHSVLTMQMQNITWHNTTLPKVKHILNLCCPHLLAVRFTPAQAELYEAVLEVQRSCLSLCSPGVSLDHIYNTMLALLGRQLRQLGIVKASTSEADLLKVIIRGIEVRWMSTGRSCLSSVLQILISSSWLLENCFFVALQVTGFLKMSCKWFAGQEGYFSHIQMFSCSLRVRGLMNKWSLKNKQAQDHISLC